MLGASLLRSCSFHFEQLSNLSTESVLAAPNVGQATITSRLRCHNAFFLPSKIFAPISLQACLNIAVRTIFLKFKFDYVTWFVRTCKVWFLRILLVSPPHTHLFAVLSMVISFFQPFCFVLGYSRLTKLCNPTNLFGNNHNTKRKSSFYECTSAPTKWLECLQNDHLSYYYCSI